MKKKLNGCVVSCVKFFSILKNKWFLFNKYFIVVCLNYDRNIIEGYMKNVGFFNKFLIMLIKDL